MTAANVYVGLTFSCRHGFRPAIYAPVHKLHIYDVDSTGRDARCDHSAQMVSLYRLECGVRLITQANAQRSSLLDLSNMLLDACIFSLSEQLGDRQSTCTCPHEGDNACVSGGKARLSSVGRPSRSRCRARRGVDVCRLPPLVHATSITRFLLILVMLQVLPDMDLQPCNIKF